MRSGHARDAPHREYVISNYPSIYSGLQFRAFLMTFCERCVEMSQLFASGSCPGCCHGRGEEGLERDACIHDSPCQSFG